MSFSIHTVLIKTLLQNDWTGHLAANFIFVVYELLIILKICICVIKTFILVNEQLVSVCNQTVDTDVHTPRDAA